MELVNNQKALYTAFLCIGYGVLCGWFSTMLSLLFFRKKRTRIVAVFKDISLFFWSAIGLFLLSLPLTDGRPRFWLFAGTAAGFFSWKRGAEQPFLRILHRVHTPLARTVDTIGRVCGVVRLKIRKNVKKPEKNFKKLLKFKRVILYNKSK